MRFVALIYIWSTKLKGCNCWIWLNEFTRQHACCSDVKFYPRRKWWNERIFFLMNAFHNIPYSHKLKTLWWSVIFTVPSRPPSDISGRHINTTALMFRWNPVADDHKNGIILGYRWVFFNSSGSVLKSADAADMTMAETFGGLEVWRNYSFILCAYTIKGDGNWSAPMTVATDEEGKGLTKQVKADCFNKVRVNSNRKHPPWANPGHLIHDESQGPGIW